MNRLLRLSTATCLLGPLFFFISCQKDRPENKEKIVTINLAREVSTLDPVNSYDTVSGTVLSQVYEPLFQYHYLKRPYQIIPLLAEGLPQVSADKLTYTFKIKKGIRYHDDPSFKGKPRTVKAQDFIIQLKRLAFLPNRSNGWWMFDGKIQGLNQFRKSVGRDLEKLYSTPVSGLQAIDDHTLQIKLTEPFPRLLFALAMTFSVPIPEEVVRYYKNDLNNIVVGTGAFYLDKWNKSLEVILKKFPGFRDEFFPSEGDRFAHDNKMLIDAGKQLPFIDGIHYKIIKEDQTAWLNFLSHKLDLIQIPKDSFSSAVEESGGLKGELVKKKISLQIAPTLIYWWLSFNMTDPLFGKNKNLRLAIAHGFNVEKFISTFTNNVGQKANSIYPPGIPGYNPARELPYRYDLKKAKEYLRKAGHPDGKGLPTLTFEVRGNNTTQRQRAEFIKIELEKLGLKVETVLNSFPGFLKKAKGGDLSFWQDGWALDYPDSENVLQLLYSKNRPPGSNVTFYNNPQFDKLYEELSVIEDGTKKFELMLKMEDLIVEEVPWIMMFYERRYILLHQELKNYRHSELVRNYSKYIRLE